MTVAAIATANAPGGIGIVRLSGEKSVEIAEKLFFGKSVFAMQSHTMHLGKIKYNGRVYDEVLLCVFRAPNSYTGEDVVEINCHGGITVCRQVLELTFALGAEPAAAGEFTKRAFLNGRIDLSQAEAVADIISAQTAGQLEVAAAQLDKSLARGISYVRQGLIDCIAHLLAEMDYSEEGVEPLGYDALLSQLASTEKHITSLLSTADDGRIICDGVNIVIAGAPNVGKSSLLNAILGEDRAIVTDISGTTRDVLETAVNIRGCRINLYDTAGIRETGDIIEQMGVERSKKTLNNANLIFFVIDGSLGIDEKSRAVLALLDKSKTVLIVNKSDLPQTATETDGFLASFNISAKSGDGLERLYAFISESYGGIEITGREIITNPRHKESLIKAQRLIRLVTEGISGGTPFDLVLSDLELAIAALGEIGGETVSEEIIDNIFANFCVGK